MVLTAAQTTNFFEHPVNGMAIPHETVVRMATEGITSVSDLAELTKDSFKQMVANFRKPAGMFQPPALPAVPPAAPVLPPMEPLPPVVFGAISQRRLSAACDLIRFYQMIGRELTVANINWDPVISNFAEQWKPITEAFEKGETGEVPKISKVLPIITWIQAFEDFLAEIIGVRMVPLSYVIREDAVVPAAVPALAQNQPHSTQHGSVEADMIARASHTHALFRYDNKKVYHLLESATRSTQYAATIKPFQRMKNGRGAFLALMTQYAGVDKWQAVIKTNENIIHNYVWKGQNNFPLEKFVGQHRSAYVALESAQMHIPDYQLPSEHTRVGYLLDHIQCSDAELQATIASIRSDPGGMRVNFEAAVAHIIPSDPVARRLATAGGGKRSAAQISTVDGDGTAEVSAMHFKQARGSTGVELRWHNNTEFKALTQPQKDELREWREANPEEMKKSKKKSYGNNGPSKKGGKGQGTKSQSLSKKQVATLVASKVDAAIKKVLSQEEEGDKETAYIQALVDAAIAKKSKPNTAAAASAVPPPKLKLSLQSILKNAKNSSKSD
jgi:hypothetical protein